MTILKVVLASGGIVLHTSDNKDKSKQIKKIMDKVKNSLVHVQKSDFDCFDGYMLMGLDNILASFDEIADYLDGRSIETINRLRIEEFEESKKISLILQKNRLKGRYHYKMMSADAREVEEYLTANGATDSQFQ